MTQFEKNAVMEGTLSLMVLRTLMTMGELYGYGIAHRLEARHLNSGAAAPSPGRDGTQ